MCVRWTSSTPQYIKEIFSIIYNGMIKEIECKVARGLELSDSMELKDGDRF